MIIVFVSISLRDGRHAKYGEKAGLMDELEDKNLFNKKCRRLRKKGRDILNKRLNVFEIFKNLGKSWEKAILN